MRGAARLLHAVADGSGGHGGDKLAVLAGHVHFYAFEMLHQAGSLLLPSSRRICNSD